MRTPALATLQRADRMNRQARNGRELFLREARRLAKRFELRAECPRSAGFHDPLSYMRPVRASYSPVRVMSVSAKPDPTLASEATAA
jgi:hypothetical protein